MNVADRFIQDAANQSIIIICFHFSGKSGDEDHADSEKGLSPDKENANNNSDVPPSSDKVDSASDSGIEDKKSDIGPSQSQVEEAIKVTVVDPNAQKAVNKRKSNAPIRLQQKDTPANFLMDHQDKLSIGTTQFEQSILNLQQQRVDAEKFAASLNLSKVNPLQSAGANSVSIADLSNKGPMNMSNFPQIASLLLAAKQQQEMINKPTPIINSTNDDDNDDDDDSKSENGLVINGDFDDDNEKEYGEIVDDEEATRNDNDHNHNTVTLEEGEIEEVGVPSPPSDYEENGLDISPGSTVREHLFSFEFIG